MSTTTEAVETIPPAVATMSDTRVAVYRALREHGESTAAELAAATAMTESATRRSANDLIDAGLATRRERISFQPGTTQQWRLDEPDDETQMSRRTGLPVALAELPESRLNVYRDLRSNGEATAVEVIADSDHSEPTVYRALRDLEAAGLVEKRTQATIPPRNSGDLWSVTDGESR